MTVVIKRSQIRGMDFPLMVDIHAREMAAWTAHMRMVQQGKADPYPAPQAPPIVESAVRQVPRANGDTDFNSDYTIEEDDPTPMQVHAGRKNALMSEVTRMEHEAYDAVLAPGKRRLYNLRHTEVWEKRSKVEHENGKIVDATNQRDRAKKWLLEQGDRETTSPEDQQHHGDMIANMKATIQKSEEFLDVAKVQELPADDVAFLADHTAWVKRQKIVERWAAEQHAAIEDLTPDTIAAWQPTPIPSMQS